MGEAMVPGTLAVSPPRGGEVVRDIKLRVFQRHYEATLSEAVEVEKALLSAPVDIDVAGFTGGTWSERKALTAKAKALHVFADKLEADIRALTDSYTRSEDKVRNTVHLHQGRAGGATPAIEAVHESGAGRGAVRFTKPLPAPHPEVNYLKAGEWRLENPAEDVAPAQR
jgi:hypothetical protein